ncbi:hypothetical protein HGG75_20040 [Ochrobactrum pseudogrignonense]|nr:hypothetical protein [Brucella pseudogrignonensis]
MLQPCQRSCMRRRLKSVGLEALEYLQKPGTLSLCRKPSRYSCGNSEDRSFIGRQGLPAGTPRLDLGPETAATPENLGLRLDAVQHSLVAHCAPSICTMFVPPDERILPVFRP